MDRAVAHWAASADRHPAQDRLRALTDSYVAGNMDAHRCPMPALAGDMAREPADSKLRQAFTDGVRGLAKVATGDGDRERALQQLAAMVGAVTLARASADPDFAAEILDAVRNLARG
jgi:TetR/AcrR family transcriptional repressor of nem operon